MDGDPADLSLLDAHVRRHLELIRSDRRMARRQTPRSEALHQHVSDLLECVKQQLGDVPADGSGHAAFSSYAMRLRFAASALQTSHCALPWLEAVHEPLLNLGSLYLAEEMARDIVHHEVGLIVVPDSAFMYSTTWWPFLGYLRTNPTFTPRGTRRPIVLKFPLTDAHRVLLHPVFAHELGHSAVEEHRLLDAVRPRLEADPSYTGERNAAVNVGARLRPPPWSSFWTT